MKQRIRIAQIGIGHNHAADKMIALRKLPELFEVVGFSEDDPRWLKERGGFEAYQGLPRFSEQELLNLPGLDAVAVETDGFELVPTAMPLADHQRAVRNAVCTFTATNPAENRCRNSKSCSVSAPQKNWRSSRRMSTATIPQSASSSTPSKKDGSEIFSKSMPS